MEKVSQYRKNVANIYNNLNSGTNQNLIQVSGRILRFGVQAAPGTKLALNGKADQTIIVGASGIYELNLDNHFSLVKSLLIIFDENNQDPFILDIVYEV